MEQITTGDGTVREDRTLSLPNLLTYGRIAAVPALVACFFMQGDFASWLAVGIFVAAGITDYLDGYFSRA